MDAVYPISLREILLNPGTTTRIYWKVSAVANIALAQNQARNDSILMGTWSTRAVRECSTQKTRKGLEKRSSA